MIRKIEKFSNLFEIIIVDNGSTYKPTLEWYKYISHKVIYLDNIGHTAPWNQKVLDQISTDFYIVSDCDLDISNLPNCTLDHLASILMYNPHLGKIGVGLNCPNEKYKKKYIISWEAEKFYNSLPIINGLYRCAYVDTTFAMYHKTILSEYKVCGARTIEPYQVDHLPWDDSKVELIKDEFEYYLKNANYSSGRASAIR